MEKKSIDESTDVFHSVMHLLPCLTAKLVRPYMSMICPKGMTQTELRILFIIAETGSIRMSDLAEAGGMSKQQLNTIVSGIEKNGYVIRTADTNDRRIVRAGLSREGSNLMDSIDQNIVQVLQPAFQNLNKKEQSELYTCSKKLTDLVSKL